MVRSHSINAVAHEIVTMSENQDLISINAIGKQSTGKTELCRTISHLIHSIAKLPYKVSFYGKDEILDLENTVKKLTPTNHILIFDDLSWLGGNNSKQQVEKIEYVLSIIRHLPGGKDTRIILFKIFHYTKSIPPFLRQNDMTFLSSVDDNEVKNLEDLLGRKYSDKIHLLKTLRAQGNRETKFTFPIGKKNSFSYKLKDPFLPYLYSNGETVRFIVCPLRTWIEPFCQKCLPAKQTEETAVNLEDFVNDFSTKFTKGIAKRAVELTLLQSGINTQPKRVLQAQKYISQFLGKKEINLEGLSLAFNLEPRKTKLFPDKQPEIMDKPKVVSQIGNVLDFDVQELKTYAKPHIQRENWVEPFWKQSKNENLETYSLLQTLYKEKQESATAINIKALYNVIKKRG